MTHHRVASVSHDDLEGAVAMVEASAAVADRVEVRLDALWAGPPDEATATETLLRLTQAASRHGADLVATLRPKRQGGGFEGPEEVRLGLLVAAARAGFAAVDVESDHKDLDRLTRLFRDESVDAIISDHAQARPPSRDDGLLLLRRMQDAHGAAEKIAFPVHSFADTLRALELAHAHAGRGGRPAVAPIGQGAGLRALLALAGNRLTYGHAPAPDGKVRPAVAGQPALAEIQAVWDHWDLTGDDLDGCGEGAGWYAILGGRTAHSLSPALHNRALRDAGLPERYGALDVPDSIGAMRLLATVAGRIGLRGASVTSPLKHHALAVATPDEAAQATGAANCLRFDEDGVHATNTDVTALERLLARPLAQPLVEGDAGQTIDGARGAKEPGGQVAVLGAGGAARAALLAAKRLGLEATFTSRDADRARQVEKDLGAPWIPWDRRGSLRPDVWVQATSLGSDPADEAPLSTADLEGASRLVELVYAHGPTALQRHAAAAGVDVMDGRRMLLEQALDAFRFWTGRDPPAAVMQEVLA